MLDTSTPNLARACDYMLGGGASFAADRALALRLEGLYPGIRDMLFSSRSYVADAVARVARSGTAQFLDLGSGLPTTPAVHETARAFQPGARVAYVDRDPEVVRHGQALVPAGVRYLTGDLAEPEAILASGELHGFIDFSRPVCLILALVLQTLDPGTARAVGGILVRALPPGSHLIATAVAGQASLPGFTWTGVFTEEDLASFFAGVDLVAPGVTSGPGAQQASALCAAGIKQAPAAVRPASPPGPTGRPAATRPPRPAGGAA
ncbi:MAG TPA: SAM-dependent methyltransferase [Trebonia sp.]|nr:SAM-dependent methyltransferase [Trebonia sp.]